MSASLTSHSGAAALLEANRRFYDPLWSGARLVAPDRFNTWPLVQELVAPSLRRLELGPGLRPRLPIAGTHFVDISAPAISVLRDQGGHAVLGQASALPYPDGIFDLVCALDIIEHIEDDAGALKELVRVAAPGAALLIAVPLHPARWTAFDDFVGHCRRYEPAALLALLSAHQLAVERSAVYGMQPKSSRLLDLGMWGLTHRRAQALWWYNRVFMPLGLRFQAPLVLMPGMLDASAVDEVLLLCRRAGGGNPASG